MITTILLSWKREANMPKIVEALRAQTMHGLDSGRSLISIER